MASCRRTSVRASTRLCADVATAEGEYRNVIFRCRRPERRQCGTQTPGLIDESIHQRWPASQNLRNAIREATKARAVH